MTGEVIRKVLVSVANVVNLPRACIVAVCLPQSFILVRFAMPSSSVKSKDAAGGMANTDWEATLRDQMSDACSEHTWQDVPQTKWLMD